MHPRRPSPRRPRLMPARRLGFEPLESRWMQAADLPFAVERLVWQGLAADAREGYWNGRFESATPYGTPALPPDLLPLPTWTTTSLGEGFFTLHAPDADPQLVVDWAAQTPGVLVIEPDLLLEAPLGAPSAAALAGEIEPEALPNDPDYPLQWAPPLLEAPVAWSASIGARSVIVAVLDSGIDLTHPDLAGNVWANPREIAGNGIDDDTNGFVDDVNGWNFISNTNNVQDGYGHGTHVAGIIGAVGNNGVGIAGLNWQVSLLNLKIISDAGIGTVSAALAAISYVTTMRRDLETNIVVTNNSWTADGFSVVMRDAIAALNDLNIGFVAAAGNSASDNDILPRYPASYDVPNVVAVAASTSSDTLASFSNYGSQSVDLAAPGSSIYSTLNGGRYGFLSGTSMATPQVAGAYALLAAAKSTLTVPEIRSAILGSTDTEPDMVGKTVTGGRLNINGAMRSLGITPSPPPDPPPPPPPPVPADQPFADDFNVPDSATLSGFWSTRLGAVGIANKEATTRGTGVSIATLNGVAIVDSVSQAFVNLRTSSSVGLVARYSGRADTNMYLASIQRSGTNFVGRIWRNLGGTWTILVGGTITASSGVMRFEVAGSSLTLLFNGIRVAGTFDRSITGPGGVGIRLTGAGGSLDNYSQDTLTPPPQVDAVLPFADSFTAGGDTPYLPGAWTKRLGNLAVTSNTVVSRFNGVSLMALNGVAVADSSTQAFVNIVTGVAVNLVARYTGTGDSRMYAAGLARTSTGFVGRIRLNRGTGWVVLASGPAVGGSGILRFDVAGTALTLFLNDKKIAAASNRALTAPGTVGLRFNGAASVADNFAAAELTPPTPTAVVTPFSDDFIRPDSVYISGNWRQPFGNIRLSGDTLVSQIAGASIASLNGVKVRNSSAQAVVNIGGGTAAGLVARYGGNGDRGMYLAGLVRVGDAYEGRIWLHDGIRWWLLGSARTPGGSGRIRFDCIGSCLTLFLNGTRIVAVHNTTLSRAGAVGVRLVGDGSTVDGYAYEQG